MAKIPELKKKIVSFLTKEDGKISKEMLIKVGAVVASLAAASSVSAQCCSPPADSQCHTNSLAAGYTGGTASGTHNHCVASHSSHSSHCSHCSHNHSW